jgi:hypothetical protein
MGLLRGAFRDPARHAVDTVQRATGGQDSTITSRHAYGLIPDRNSFP